LDLISRNFTKAAVRALAACSIALTRNLNKAKTVIISTKLPKAGMFRTGSNVVVAAAAVGVEEVVTVASDKILVEGSRSERGKAW